MAADGRLPPFDSDPFQRMEADVAAASAAGDPDAAIRARRPWAGAGGREESLKAIEALLRLRPDMRATGGRGRGPGEGAPRVCGRVPR